MAKKRVTRKQLLKEPDEFFTTTGNLIQWAQEHTRSLLLGSGVVLGILVLIVSYGYYQQAQSDKATLLYHQAMVKYQNAGGEKEPAAALTAARPDLERLADQYPGQPAGKLGRIMYANLSLASQARDEAVSIYTSALKDFGSDIALANFIHNGLGAAYSQKGDFAAAIDHYEKIVNGTSTVLKDSALFHLGRLYEAMGQADKSQEAYRQLTADFAESMFAEIAKEKVRD
jgi:tetratricopeptide (TPR) repeat protein